MKVKFLQDFQGVETFNQFFKKDEQAEFEQEVALRLVRENRAVEVVEEVAQVYVIDEPVILTGEPKKKVKK